LGRVAVLSRTLQDAGCDEMKTRMFDTRNDYNYIVMLMMGEFEYSILSAAARLGEETYGTAIRDTIQQATQRRCSIGALYTTLNRLETKGLIKTRMGDPTPERGGRSKRLVRITAKGVEAASEFYEAIQRLSRGVSWEANRISIR
jgi:PadR family transcriptional regulator, regulatory protein PadR